jgi:hypothetical protein
MNKKDKATRNKYVKVTLSQEEHDLLWQQANEAYLPLATYARQLLFKPNTEKY